MVEVDDTKALLCFVVLLCSKSVCVDEIKSVFAVEENEVIFCVELVIPVFGWFVDELLQVAQTTFALKFLQFFVTLSNNLSLPHDACDGVESMSGPSHV